MAQSTNVFFSSVPGVHWPAVPTEMGARYLALLAQLEASEWWPPERLRAAQLRQIDLLLCHAARHVPFFGDRLRGAGFVPGMALTWETFARLPVLERADVQKFRYELISQADLAGHGERLEGSTSGSTGRPVRFQSTSLSAAVHGALSLRDHLWHGRDLSAKHAAIAHKIEDRDLNGWGPVVGAVFFTGKFAQLSIAASIEQQVHWLRRQDPTYLSSYPSNVAALARRCLELGVRLPRLKELRTFGELVSPELPGLCRETWDVPLTDLYSAEEVGIIALQCPRQPAYHVQSEAVLVEILDPSGRACEPGQTGRVVITPLHNFAMPLIRYAIGDYAEAGEPCPCGRGLPVLRRIVGRARNTLITASGERYWPTFGSRSFTRIAPVLQHQFVQKSFDTIEARLVTRTPLTGEQEEGLRRHILARIPPGFRLTFVYCDEIARSSGGKYEDFLSEIADATPGSAAA